MRTLHAAPRRALLVGAASAGALAGCASGPRTSPQVPAGTPRTSRPVGIDRDPAFARHLLNRFGYGPRPGDIDRLVATGAAAWLDEQLAPASATPDPRIATALAPLASLQQNHTATLATFARLQGDALRPGLGETERAAANRELNALVRRINDESRQDRLVRALYSGRPLEESLVEFWFNHFNVFAGKESVRVTAGFFEREAIRPHVLGRFRDLLGATARHPAMLNYLDNWQSVADGFRFPAQLPMPAGFVPPRGLNENYARELLELHTLGVDGGYTQGDVRELARVFTGWSFDRRNPGTDHAFRFYAARHDRGDKTLLGARIDGDGVQQGERALDRLAAHPSTARHVARRLARAYVADVPPPALVERLAARFAATGGDLREVVRALATSPEFTDPAIRGGKFKTPYHYVLSSARAVGAEPAEVLPLAQAIARMGMPIHGCVTPDGWKDTRDAWLNAEALRQRVAYAVQLAGGTSRAAEAVPTLRPVRLDAAATSIEPLPEPVAAALGAVARDALAGLPARERLAAALASPDFMRR